MIQIRAAVASGLLLVALYFKESHSLIKFLITVCIAFLFHYSSILILPLWCLSTNKIQKYLIWLIPICYGLNFFGIFLTNILSLVHLGFVEQALIMHASMESEEINVFNFQQLLRCLICFWLWINIYNIKDKNKYSLILLKTYTIGIATLPLFANVPVFAFRISELYLVVEILLIPLLIYTFTKQNRLLGYSVVAGISTIFLYFNIFYLEFLK